MQFESAAPRVKKARMVKEGAPPLPAEAAPAAPDSEWIQCDLCLKWRIVKCTDLDELPDDAVWVCSMNRDVRHNSCAAKQRLWMSSAPEDGERVTPRGHLHLTTLHRYATKLEERQAADLQSRLPLSMQRAGWVLLPSGGTFASHRLDYAYVDIAGRDRDAAEAAALAAAKAERAAARKGKGKGGKRAAGAAAVGADGKRRKGAAGGAIDATPAADDGSLVEARDVPTFGTDRRPSNGGSRRCTTASPRGARRSARRARRRRASRTRRRRRRS